MMANLSQAVARQLWNLERFGISPKKAWHRFANPNTPKVLCNSIPKAGTHLLERAICLHPGFRRKLIPTVHAKNISKWGDLYNLLDALRCGEVIVSHLSFTSERLAAIERSNTHCFFMVRDPRDIVSSQVFYLMKQKDHQWHKLFQSCRDSKERFRLAIEGDASARLLSIRERLENYVGWLNSGGLLLIRFEELIGPDGGGERSTQLRVLRSIFDHLRVDVTDNFILSLSQKLFSSVSPTFRRGGIGQWKQHFDGEIKDLFKQVAGELLIHYGYEGDDGW